MAVEMAFVKALVAQHNDPGDPILIYNIQGTSGVNLFPQRMKDDTITIVEDDISWNEEHNNGMVITRRTGIDNIDLVSYYDSSLIKEQRHLS